MKMLIFSLICSLRPSLLERMPPMESKSSAENNNVIQNGDIGEDELNSVSKDDKDNNKNIEDSVSLLNIY